jgi:hypothetical protein
MKHGGTHVQEIDLKGLQKGPANEVNEIQLVRSTAYAPRSLDLRLGILSTSMDRGPPMTAPADVQKHIPVVTRSWRSSSTEHLADAGRQLRRAHYMQAGTSTPQISHAATGGHGVMLLSATFGPRTPSSPQLVGTNERFVGMLLGGAMVIDC